MSLRVHWMVAALICPACYSPHDAATTGEVESSSESGGTSGATTTATTTSAMTTTGMTSTSASTTGETEASSDTTADTGEDLPPVLSEFSVNGDEMPSEILEAEIVEIQVAAEDDVGIDRVEFYDGETLIASFTEPPYITEVLVTSADNGGHSYTAVAWDTAEQMAEAGPIPLSVGIDGGAVLELQDAGFEASSYLSLLGPVITATEDRVFVAATNLLTGAGFTRFRMATSRLSLGLSSAGVSYFPTNVTAATSHHEFGGRAAVDDDGDLLLPVSVRPNGGDGVLHLLRVSTDDGVTTDVTSYGADSSAYAGFASVPDDGFAANTGPGRVARYPSAGAAATWSTDALEGLETESSILSISTDADGAVILGGIESTSAFVRKLSPDGDVLWTRSVEDVAESAVLHTAFAAVAADGNVSLAASHDEANGSGVQLVTYDGDGNALHDVVVEPGTPAVLSDLAFDSQQRVVIAASIDLDPTDAWIGRYDVDGTEIWSGVLDVESNAALVTDVVVLPSGRLFATGLRDTTPEFLSTAGDVWVAELAL